METAGDDGELAVEGGADGEPAALDAKGLVGRARVGVVGLGGSFIDAGAEDEIGGCLFAAETDIGAGRGFLANGVYEVPSWVLEFARFFFVLLAISAAKKSWVWYE